MIKTHTLKNGIKVVVNKIDGLFSVTAGILVGAGSALETLSENGISHFIEHVNFKGTNARSAFEISREIDSLGAMINAFTSKEYTCYYVKSVGEHLAKAFEVLADIFNDSLYLEEELQKEKGVVIEEINMYQDTPDELCTDLLSLAYFGNNGYGRTILGKEKNICSFNRDSIISYKNKFYTTDSIVISFAGDVDFEVAVDLCEKYFDKIPASKRQKPAKRNFNNKNGQIKKNKNIEQTHFALALNGTPIYSEKSDTYSIISNALGGGMSSRLFQTVREKMGLCYNIYSYMNSFTDCGTFNIYAGVNSKLVDKAYAAVLSELDKLKKEGLDKEEFSRAKEQIKSSFLFAQERTSSQMSLYGKYLLFNNEIFDLNESIVKLNALTLDEVNTEIKNCIDIENISTAIVGKGVKTLNR